MLALSQFRTSAELLQGEVEASAFQVLAGAYREIRRCYSEEDPEGTCFVVRSEVGIRRGVKICQRYVFNVDLGDCDTIASIMFSVVPFQIDCHASIWTGSQCQAFLADGSLLVLVLLSSYIGLCKGSPGCTAPLELCSGAGERAMCARLRQTVWWGGVCSCWAA